MSHCAPAAQVLRHLGARATPATPSRPDPVAGHTPLHAPAAGPAPLTAPVAGTLARLGAEARAGRTTVTIRMGKGGITAAAVSLGGSD